MSVRIRRARPEDAKEIHDAHMQSIREICSVDYSPVEISAWSGRAFREIERVQAIQNQFVWVVVGETGRIEGYAQLGFSLSQGRKVTYIHGLYLTPTVKGHGWGRVLVEEMIEESRQAGVDSVLLDSTLNARSFYRHMGFRDSGPISKIRMGGVDLACQPMEMLLSFPSGPAK